MIDTCYKCNIELEFNVIENTRTLCYDCTMDKAGY